MEIVPGHYLFKNFYSPGYFSAILCERNIVQVEVKNVPRTLISPQRAYPVCSCVFRSIIRRAIRLEPILSSQIQEFLLDNRQSSFQFSDKRELSCIPPALKTQSRNQIGATQLPRMVFFRQFSAVYLHEEPFSQSFHFLAVSVAYFVFYELLCS